MLDLYGDESCGVRAVSYALLVLPEKNRAQAERALASAKSAFGGAADTPLHCRAIFGPSARARSDWKHLNGGQVLELYRTVLSNLAETETLRMVVVAQRDDFPRTVEGAPWQHKDPNLVGPMPWSDGFPIGEKQLAVFCGIMALIPFGKIRALRKFGFGQTPTPLQSHGLVGSSGKQAEQFVVSSPEQTKYRRFKQWTSKDNRSLPC